MGITAIVLLGLTFVGICLTWYFWRHVDLDLHFTMDTRTHRCAVVTVVCFALTLSFMAASNNQHQSLTVNAKAATTRQRQ